MEDLLGAYSTISLWLGNNAVDARFELARFVAERDKYTELSALNRFLQNAAGARIKYPRRMRNLDEEFIKLRHHSLTRLESELFELLPSPGIKDPGLRKLSDEQITRLGRELHASAETLFKIDRQYGQALRDYIDTQGV